MKKVDDIIIRRSLDGEVIDEYNLEDTTDVATSEPADPRTSKRRRTTAGTGTEAAQMASRSARSSADGATGKRAAKAVKSRGKHDPYIWGIYIMLLMVSVIELFSASSAEVKASNIYYPLIRHGIYLAVGLGIVLFLQNIHYGYFSRFAWFLAIVSLGLLLYSSLFGANINGAQRAIRLVGGGTIQPAEIVKLTVVMLLATILGRNQQPGGVTNRGVFTVALIVVVFAGILWINGLTNTLILMGVSVAMFLIGGIQWRKLGVVFLVYGIAVGVLMIFKYNNNDVSDFDRVAQEQTASAGSGSAMPVKEIGRAKTHMNRFDAYKNGVHPHDTINDANRQVYFAKMAQANGGVMGKGPGNSRENARLPLAFSDYIYSIIVEDTGFVGGVALLLLYLLLMARAGKVAYNCSRAFPAFLIMGCAVLIVFQALVHMAIVTGVAPVSGQPLPFISKGGTSILVMSAAIGIMLSVSRFAVTTDNKKEIKDELAVLPEDIQAANISSVKE